LYVPGPLTVALPTVVPPVVQVVGAVDCGPNTMKVIVPPAPLVVPASVELTEPAAIAVAATPLEGAAALVVGLAFETVVDDMPDPHVLADTPL
jgi:hypothetical protein